MLFDREHEVQQLDRLFAYKPTEIKVVLGPRSSGKTALLQHYLQTPKHAIYVNCRYFKATEPFDFVGTVLAQLACQVAMAQPAQETWLEDWLKKAPPVVINAIRVFKATVKLPVGDVQFDLDKLLQGAGSNTNPDAASGGVTALFAAIRQLLDMWQETWSPQDPQAWPLLVIDEANKLMEWRETDRADLSALLTLLVALTKESKRCHVLLVTSEYGIQSWLNTGIGSGFWTPVVIGDFVEDEARKFLEMQLAQLDRGNLLDDAAWRRTYQVCGGNAGALVRLAVRVAGHPNWDTALEELWSGESTRVELLALGKQDCWTSAQYAEAALQLLAAPHHAVAQARLEELLGCHVVGDNACADEQRAAGLPVLEQLVKANALGLRPWSLWARDVPIAAFQDTRSVVTAPSTLDLYCMRRMYPQLQQRLERWRQKKWWWRW